MNVKNNENKKQTNFKLKFIASAVFALLFALLIIMVRTVDVDAIGSSKTKIGLSHINKAINDFSGLNMALYDITEWLGVISIATGCAFAFLGLVQLIKRKSLIKVDKEILALGGLYAVIGALYVLFEIAIVNYRPVIMEGETKPEASFPSSHTMLICVIMGSVFILAGKYIKDKRIRVALRVVCTVIMAFTVFARLFCGVHWFTDILGGVLISASLLLLYLGVVDLIKIDRS